MSSLTDRIREFNPGYRRFAPRDASGLSAPGIREVDASQGPAASGLDAETLEVVRKFEASYSELVPPAPAPSREEDSMRGADLDMGLLDEELVKAFADSVPSREPRAAAHVRRRFGAAPPAAARPSPLEDREKTLSFEDAMTTLRASEARGKAATADRPRIDADESSTGVDGPPQALRPPQVTPGLTPALPADPLAANDSWATRSRQVWPKVAAAAALALLVGTGAGYIAGKAPNAGASRGTIPTTPEGGAQLRFDYDLNTR